MYIFISHTLSLYSFRRMCMPSIYVGLALYRIIWKERNYLKGINYRGYKFSRI